MTLTYIFHSGFVLETEKFILIFDYWLDLNGVLPPFLKKDKPVYVFSSHFHEDHFNSAIFEWRKQHKNITYILSKDIYKHRRANKEDADVWLAKGGTWSDETLSVWALGSTDSGISWIVETEKQNRFCNIFRMNQFTHRNDWKNRLFQIGVNPSCLSGTWCNTIDVNAVLCYFQGYAAGKCFKCSLTCSVGYLPGKNL
jgi:hypothetical protein